MFGGRLCLPLRTGLVSVSVGGHDQLRKWRKPVGAADLQFLPEKAAVIVVASVTDRGMIGRVGLDEHLRRRAAATSPASHLGQQAEGPLRRTVVGKMEAGIRVDDARGGPLGRV